MSGSEYSAMPLVLCSGTVLVLVLAVIVVLLGLQMVKRTENKRDQDVAVETATDFDTVRDAIAREIRGMTMDRAHAHIRVTRPWMRFQGSAFLLDNGDIVNSKIGYLPAPWAIQLVPKRGEETSPRPQLRDTNAFLTALPNQPLTPSKPKPDTRPVVAFLLHQKYAMGPNGISKTTLL